MHRGQTVKGNVDHSMKLQDTWGREHEETTPASHQPRTVLGRHHGHPKPEQWWFSLEASFWKSLGGKEAVTDGKTGS